MGRDEALQRAAELVSTPCYVYFPDEIRDRVTAVRDAFGGRFQISYAVKANPNRGLLRALHGVVDQLDVSSGGEVDRALEAGWSPAALSFTGPAKRGSELEGAVRHGVGHVVVENLAEADELDAIARSAGRVQPVLLRITPDHAPSGFGLTMAGRPCAFGVDEAHADDAVAHLASLPSLALDGLHIYAATQGLVADAVAEALEISLEVFRALGDRHDLHPRQLVFGAGFGIPYHAGDTALDLAAVAQRLAPRLDALVAEDRFAHTALTLESGRYLVGEAGVFVTRVLRTKVSRGVRIAMCDGGLNHHLAACGHFGSVIHRNYPLHRVGGPDGPVVPVDLVGPLCTTIDTLGRKAPLPELSTGDLIAVGCSGAYGRSASPLGFISHPPPCEVLARRDRGGWVLQDVSEA